MSTPSSLVKRFRKSRSTIQNHKDGLARLIKAHLSADILLQIQEPAYSSAWLSLSPAYAPYRVLSGYGADAAGFLTSIVATLTWSAGCLILACAVLSRSWRNDPDVGPGWRLRRPSWLRPDAVRWAEIRRVVLDKNPFQWRVQRDQRPVERAYLIVIAICLLWLTGWCAWGRLWPSTMNFFITALLLVMVIDWLAIHAAARRIGEDRRDGMFELLLTTGLSPRQIVEGQLERVKKQLHPGEMDRSIWMIQPPSSLGMDICGDGRQVGSPTVSKFIRKNQPLLGCSGHIHESPYQPGGRWVNKIGRTAWFQPGRMDYVLLTVSLEVTDNLAVRNVRHSVLGESKN